MKRSGSVLVITLVLCAILALVLVGGVQVASVGRASEKTKIELLQMEQLYRSALSDCMRMLEANTEPLRAELQLLSDEPIAGQHRRAWVENIKENVLTLGFESQLDTGARKEHAVEIFALDLEPRCAFSKAEQALFYTAARAVPERWLAFHKENDLVIVCGGEPSRRYHLGSGRAISEQLQGSLVVCAREGGVFRIEVETPLVLQGNAVFLGDVHLARDLSCKEAWIDGTLTLGEGMRLEADTVVLAEDVSTEVLQGLDARTVYVPHPPETTADEESARASEETAMDIRPLSELEEQQPEKTIYLMLQQLE